MLSFLVLLAAVLLAWVPTTEPPPTRRTLSISSGTVVSREWQPSLGTSAVDFNNNVVVDADSSTAVTVFPPSALESIDNDDNNDDDAVAALQTLADQQSASTPPHEQEGISVSLSLATMHPMIVRPCILPAVDGVEIFVGTSGSTHARGPTDAWDYWIDTLAAAALLIERVVIEHFESLIIIAVMIIGFSYLAMQTNSDRLAAAAVAAKHKAEINLIKQSLVRQREELAAEHKREVDLLKLELVEHTEHLAALRTSWADNQHEHEKELGIARHSCAKGHLSLKQAFNQLRTEWSNDRDVLIKGLGVVADGIVSLREAQETGFDSLRDAALADKTAVLRDLKEADSILAKMLKIQLLDRESLASAIARQSEDKVKFEHELKELRAQVDSVVGLVEDVWTDVVASMPIEAAATSPPPLATSDVAKSPVPPKGSAASLDVSAHGARSSIAHSKSVVDQDWCPRADRTQRVKAPRCTIAVARRFPGRSGDDLKVHKILKLKLKKNVFVVEWVTGGRDEVDPKSFPRAVVKKLLTEHMSPWLTPWEVDAIYNKTFRRQ